MLQSMGVTKSQTRLSNWTELNKGMLTILQAKFQQHINLEIEDVQTGFIKGRETRGQIGNIHWIIEKARELKKKKSISASLTMAKSTVWITTNCRTFLKTWKYQHLSSSWETCIPVKKQQWEPDIEEQMVWNGGGVGNDYIVTLFI